MPESAKSPDRSNAKLTEWVSAHPVRWGFVAGSGAMFVWSALNRLPLLPGVLLAVPFGVLNWWIWRPGGPAHGWRARTVRRFPPKGE